MIQSDNGPEFTGRVLDQWAYDRQVRLQFIQPGKPIHNDFIESFNSRLSEERLNEHVFVSLDDVRRKLEQWRIEYNRERPHSSLAYLTPEEFAAKADNPASLASRAPLGQLNHSLTDRCNALQPRIQNQILFSAALKP